MPRGGRGRGRFLRLLPDRPGPLCVLVARLVAVVVVVVLIVKIDVVEAVLAMVTVPPPATVVRVQLLHEQHLETIFLWVESSVMSLATKIPRIA